jgi:hypothetical protein
MPRTLPKLSSYQNGMINSTFKTYKFRRSLGEETSVMVEQLRRNLADMVAQLRYEYVRKRVDYAGTCWAPFTLEKAKATRALIAKLAKLN